MIYKLRFTPHFVEGLTNAIRYWKMNHWIGMAKSRKFVSLVHKTIDMLKVFPDMGQKVTQSYALSLRYPTRRLIIGNYVVFYRIDQKHHVIYVGNFFNHLQQNNVPF